MCLDYINNDELVESPKAFVAKKVLATGEKKNKRVE